MPPASHTAETAVVDELCPTCHAPVEQSWLSCAHCGGPLAVAAELPAGTALRSGRYVLHRVLGRGGFGITYVADDLRLQRRVAIKELFPESVVRHGAMALAAPEARAAFREAKVRFLREARVLARFSHPGIVRAYEVFEEHNTAYLVMELVEGRTLNQLLREQHPLPERQVVTLAARIAPALESVHAAGVLHRDVNPSNIVVTPQGRVVVLDFGIARRYDSATTGPLTRMVTPGYSPPEQYAETAGLGVATDVYGLAATLYRLLTGQLPTAALDRQQGKALASPRALRPDLSKAVSDAVLDGLELDPAHRPQTMSAFIRRLGATDIDPAAALTERAGPDLSRASGTRVAPSAPPVLVPSVPPPVLASSRAAAPPSVVSPAAPLPVGAPAPAPLGPSAAAHRGEPAVIGPRPKGRWKATVPAGVAVAALCSASPVPVLAVLVLMAGPLLATLGDLVVHEHRQRSGQAWRRWHNWSPSAVAPVRALRNVAASVVWAVPGLAVGAVTVVAGVLADGPDVVVLHDVLVRVGGFGSAALVLWPFARGGPSFRSGVGIDRARTRFVDQRGRLVQAGWILWVVAIGVTAFALWLSPEVWPFRG